MNERETLLAGRECPVCGRTVGVLKHPDHGLVMFGHRVVMPHTAETPWCQGGGRNPEALIDTFTEIENDHV